MRRNPLRPQDERARGQLRDAVLRGDINVPDNCQKCGTSNRQCSDGRRYLQAHHPDHAKATHVEWLCSKCHRQETPIPRGERNGVSRLTESTVNMAKRMCQAGATFTAVAQHFGVDRRTVARAVRGEQWKHLAARQSNDMEGEASRG